MSETSSSSLAVVEADLFTIIVPCRNEADHLENFLDDLLAQTGLQGSLNVIIADGLSDDGTRDVLASFASKMPGLQVIDNVSRFVSPGLNLAIAAASGEYVIRMDVHTRYQSDYCQQCIHVIRETGAMNVGGAARTQATGYLAEVIAAAYGSRFAVGGASFHFAEFEGEVDTVPYGCWRKADLVALGMFDERFVRNQDDELNLRIRRSGGRIWQSKAIRSWYHPRGNFSQLFRQYYQYGFWKVAVIRKHRMPASWRHLVPATFVMAGGLGLVASLLHPWGKVLFGLWGFTYLAFLLAGSVFTAAKKGWRLLPLLPVAYMCFHFGYGIGFLTGLVFGQQKAAGDKNSQLSR